MGGLAPSLHRESTDSLIYKHAMPLLELALIRKLYMYSYHGVFHYCLSLLSNIYMYRVLHSLSIHVCALILTNK